MIARIVVPLDGSMTAEAILPHLRRLLYRNDSELILVQAVLPPLVEDAVRMSEIQMAAAREYVLAQVQKLERAGVRTRYLIRVGSPVGVILDAVEEQKATMIAMTTHGSTGLKRLLFGSVAEGVIRKTPVPVLLVRPFWSYELVPDTGIERRPIRNILLPIDGSDRSAEALPGVIELAELFDSRVVLLRVLEPDKGKPAPQQECEEAEALLKRLASTIEKKKVETLRLLEAGDPIEQILKAVKENEVDLIALTTHGRGGISRAILGSVTEELLRQAPVPLLVTRNAGVAEPARKPEVAEKAT